MKCFECPYFKITQRPIKGWDFGLAECTKYNMIVDFADNRKLNRLECIKAEGEK
jgi:hypothetical protein